jgi:hypothetical protein
MRWTPRYVQEQYGRSQEIRTRYDDYLFSREEAIANAPTFEDVDVTQGFRDIMIEEWEAARIREVQHQFADLFLSDPNADDYFGVGRRPPMFARFPAFNDEDEEFMAAEVMFQKEISEELWRILKNKFGDNVLGNEAQLFMSRITERSRYRPTYMKENRAFFTVCEWSALLEREQRESRSILGEVFYRRIGNHFVYIRMNKGIYDHHVWRANLDTRYNSRQRVHNASIPLANTWEEFDRRDHTVAKYDVQFLDQIRPDMDPSETFRLRHYYSDREMYG